MTKPLKATLMILAFLSTGINLLAESQGPLSEAYAKALKEGDAKTVPPINGSPIAAACAKEYKADLSLVNGEEFNPEQPDKPYAPPYAARYEDGCKKLTFIAATHGNSPKTFRLIESEFKELSPQLVIIEGIESAKGNNSDWVVTDLMGKEHLEEKAEPIYAARLALDHKVPFLGGEIDAKSLHESLLRRGYTAEDERGFLILRTLVGFRYPMQGTEPKHSQNFSEAFQAAINQGDMDFGQDPGEQLFTEESFKRWYERRNGKVFDYFKLKTAERWPTSDAKSPLYTRRMAKDSVAIRDEHLAALFAAKLSDQNLERILVVYGAGHHIGLDDVLRQMLGVPRYFTTPSRGAP